MSEYNVKYRPQRIADLDLVSVQEGLTRVLKSGKIPHAFLFAGPRGIGKTSAARIIAKAVNCLGRRQEREGEGARGDFEPCNGCAQCLSITTGNNLDVLEIDAASNRGIDDIRDLREKVKLAPSAAAYKVYIIDEAHMLTNEAFNALLKTLEEPPKHVIFILCTTEPEKLPATIISRCTRINFKKAKEGEVVEKLEKIVAGENLAVSPEALVAVAKGSGGSFRDALKILELATFTEGKIEAEQVKELLGQTAGLVPEKLLELMWVNDAKGALGEINRVVEAGANLRIYTEQILEILRQLLLTEYDLVVDETVALKASYRVADLKRLIEIFTRAIRELKEAIIPQLPLELAVVEWCGEGIEKLAGEEKVAEQQTEKSEEKPSSSGKRTDDISLGEIQTRWKDFLLAVRPKNFSIEAFLRACRPINFDGRILTIEVFYQFHRDKLESEGCRSIVEEVASELFGAPVGLKYILGERPKKAELKEAAPEPEEDKDILRVAEEIFNGKPN